MIFLADIILTEFRFPCKAKLHFCPNFLHPRAISRAILEGIEIILQFLMPKIRLSRCMIARSALSFAKKDAIMAQDRRRVRPGLLPAASGQGERVDVLRSLPWDVAVVPLRVAWIEIYDVDLTNVVTRMSQPSRVAWIEIMQTAAMRIKQAIATREGCVD